MLSLAILFLGQSLASRGNSVPDFRNYEARRQGSKQRYLPAGNTPPEPVGTGGIDHLAVKVEPGQLRAISSAHFCGVL